MAALISRDLSHLISRHRKLLRIIAIVLACLVVINVAKPSARRGRHILTAAHDLPAGRTLIASDLVTKTIPGDLVPEGALAPGAAILGRTLTSAARKGEIITDARVLSPGLLRGTSGLVADPVRIADPASVSLLRVGDHVDVIAASDQNQVAIVQKVTSNVLVVAVPQVDPDSGGSTEGALVVLAVTSDVAQQIAKVALTSQVSVTVVS